ncbi:hypothetical protein DBR06_SOUSAS2510089, partial [Sousa chinensis]
SEAAAVPQGLAQLNPWRHQQAE